MGNKRKIILNKTEILEKQNKYRSNMIMGQTNNNIVIHNKYISQHILSHTFLKFC